MLVGKRTWIFEKKPVILSSATVVGPFEGKGRLADDFDQIYDDLWLHQDSYEKAERELLDQSCQLSIKKAGLNKESIQFFLCGDLTNQIISSNFVARTLEIPYVGLFGACSTSMEGLALSAFVVNGQGADYVLTGACSHNAVAEKQFRYPTEYGGQKPPTAQWTVTGAGTAVIANGNRAKGPVVASATIGRVMDMGLSDPFNMGGAMAPAAIDTIKTHLKERNVPASYYDLIVTGDLGKIGHGIVLHTLQTEGIQVTNETYKDCGLMIYREGQPVLSGGSGAACSAVVTYGHLLNEMKKGKLKRILIVATGALFSPITYQQKETIPCIAHAVAIEADDDTGGR